MDHLLVCQSCGSTHQPGAYPTGCQSCFDEGSAGRLEVTFDPTSIPSEAFPSTDEQCRTPESMWRYRELLPLLCESPISLSEGGTPVIALSDDSIPQSIELYVKNETVNPTWSFKDRLNSLLISNLKTSDNRRIATSSTGNHGASTAAYASVGGFDDVIVLLPNETDEPLGLQIRAYGASVVTTEYSARTHLLEKLVKRGWYPTVNITEPYSGLAYSYEAYKTIAFELVDQLPRVPDAITMSIGAGDGLYGIWKGFRELSELDVISEPPQMIGMQPIERTPVVDALNTGSKIVGTSEGPMPITTSAGGKSAGDHVLRAITESNGSALGIDRDAIERAIRIAGRHGLYLEPSSAITIAGVSAAYEEGRIHDGDCVVSIGTGAGVKWPEKTRHAVGAVPEIEPTLSALSAAIDYPEL